jgi:hypothetical protein
VGKVQSLGDNYKMEEYMAKAGEVGRRAGRVVGMALVFHFVYWLVGWMHYRMCARSFFQSMVTHGSMVCVGLETVQRSTLLKYGANMGVLAGFV